MHYRGSYNANRKGDHRSVKTALAVRTVVLGQVYTSQVADIEILEASQIITRLLGSAGAQSGTD